MTPTIQEEKPAKLSGIIQPVPVYAGTTSLSALKYWRREQLNSADLTFERVTFSPYNNSELSIIPNDSCLDNRKPNKPLVYFKTSSYLSLNKKLFLHLFYLILFHFFSFYFDLFISFHFYSFTKLNFKENFHLHFISNFGLAKKVESRNAFGLAATGPGVHSSNSN